MIKTLFAIAFLSGSISVFAEDINRYNDSNTNTFDQYNDTTATYPTDSYHSDSNLPSGQYQDTTSSTMSSTTTEPVQDSGSQYNSATNTGTMSSPDNTVTGTMGTGETLADKYQKLHVGLLTGLDSANGNENGTSAELGVDIGYQPTNIFGVGIEGTTSKLDTPDEPRRTMVLAKATARFGGDIPVLKDTFVGGAAGPVFARSKTRLGVGPLAGFDIPLTSNRAHDFLSLGLNAKYIFTNDTPDSLISAVALKYWF